MRPVYNISSYVLIQKNEHITPPVGILTINKLLHSDIICLQYNDLDDNLMVNWLLQKGFVKFFENYWISLKLKQKKNDKFMQEFYSFLAPTYDSSIHIENNLSCYEYLITQALIMKSTTTSKVLDFGSGSGIVMQSPCISRIDDIVGFDFCSEMRKISHGKGMKTLSVMEFYSSPVCEFDIIVLNYVLHLGVCLSSLNRLLDLLVVGGVLIGNIHKDLELTNIGVWLDTLMVNNFLYKVDKSQYGSILTIKKYK